MNEKPAFGPWNPGLSSRLPSDARPRVTIFDPNNCRIPLALIDERSDFTGIAVEDLAILKPERLTLHELLIRVTGDFTVPDGKVTADLGINFRMITDRIWQHAIKPKLAEIEQAYSALETSLRADIDAELERAFRKPTPPPKVEKPGLISRLFGKSPPPPPPEEPDDPATAALDAWRHEYRTSNDRRRQRLCRALARVTNHVMIRHGKLVGDKKTLGDIVLGLALNDHGSVTIGQMIRPWIIDCADELGLRLLPAQEKPVILNTKGASAAGKSTLRPLQHKLADQTGVDWDDFALISPDIWRKYLLDYDSLGDLYKYAGMCTGEEIRIIDQKLDRYIAGKAARGWRSHLLIDRFRFDSFAEDEERGLRPKLLTRFGDIIYFFFVITPPEETVVRAWFRGLELGRYKAVDDLLAHNVEAFTGMPDLFLTWATHQQKTVYFEFLDNAVPEGEKPRTVAFGTNGKITIVDFKPLIDAERYRKINIDARKPEDVYPDGPVMAAANNTSFVDRLRREIGTLEVVHPKTGAVWLKLERGLPVGAALPNPHTDEDSIAAIDILLAGTDPASIPKLVAPASDDENRAQILGQLPASDPSQASET